MEVWMLGVSGMSFYFMCSVGLSKRMVVLNVGIGYEIAEGDADPAWLGSNPFDDDKIGDGGEGFGLNPFDDDEATKGSSDQPRTGLNPFDDTELTDDSTHITSTRAPVSAEFTDPQTPPVVIIQHCVFVLSTSSAFTVSALHFFRLRA
jgi:hypothetical protein